MRRGIRDSFVLEIDESCENGELEIGGNSRVRDHEIPRVIITKNFFLSRTIINKKMSKNNCENDELEIGENSRVGDHEIPRVIIIKNLEMELGKNLTQLVKVSYWRLARVLR